VLLRSRGLPSEDGLYVVTIVSTIDVDIWSNTGAKQVQPYDKLQYWTVNVRVTV
jgi:hypothetical protein